MKIIDGWIRNYDAWVIGKLENVTTQLHLTFGVSAFTAARFMYGVWIISGVADDIEHHRFWRWSWFWLICSMMFIFGLEVDKAKRDQEARHGFKNENKINGQYVFRVFLLLMSFMGLRLPTIALTLHFYLSACDELPPGMSRMRKLWNALKEGRQVAVPEYGG